MYTLHLHETFLKKLYYIGGDDSMGQNTGDNLTGNTVVYFIAVIKITSIFRRSHENHQYISFHVIRHLRSIFFPANFANQPFYFVFALQN